MLELFADDPAAWSISRLTRDLSAEPSLAAQVAAPLARWVSLVADVVRGGQEAGQLRQGVDPDAVAAVLVGAFDGVKGIADSLGGGPATGLPALAATFAELVALTHSTSLVLNSQGARMRFDGQTALVPVRGRHSDPLLRRRRSSRLGRSAPHPRAGRRQGVARTRSRPTALWTVSATRLNAAAARTVPRGLSIAVAERSVRPDAQREPSVR